MNAIRRLLLAAALALLPAAAAAQGVSMKEGDVWTPNVNRVNPMGCATDSTAVDANDGSAVRCATNGDLFVRLTDGTTTVVVDSGNGALRTDLYGSASGLGANVLASSPTSTTNGIVTREVGSLSDNAPFTDGTTAVIGAGLIFDEIAGVALTENDIAAARIDSKRALVGVIEDNVTRGLRADLLDLTNNDALTVAIVDGAGTQITSFGGGTQYTEDAVAATDPVGTTPVMTRRDTPTALVSANLDVVSQQATNFGAAYVQILTSSGAFVDTFGGSGGTAQADESAFTEGTTNFTPMGGVLNDTITSDPTEDQAAAARITAKRAVHVNLRNASGGEIADGNTTMGLRVSPRSSGGIEIFAPPGTLVDGEVNPSVGGIEVYNMGFNGSTWDRMRSSSAEPAQTDRGVNVRDISRIGNRTASGALGALNAAVTVSAQGTGLVHWEIDTGTLAGTVVFEATLDDTNWFAINAVRINGTIVASTTTFADRGALDSGGYSQVRLRVSAFTSGTSNARLEGSFGDGLTRLSQALPAGTNSIGVLGPNSGIDIGDVTVNNAAGASAVNVQDGGNSLTVDAVDLDIRNLTAANDTVVANAGTGTFTVNCAGGAADLCKNEDDASANADRGVVLLARRTATPANTSGLDLDYEALQMSAGRLWASTVLEAGTANIGDVDVLTFPDNEPFNVAQINGVTPLMGNGITGTGSQRVTIASDNTAFTVNAAQATASSLNAEVQGDAAQDAATTGNPVMAGGSHETIADTAPTNRVSADGDASRLSVTDGALFVIPTGPQSWQTANLCSAAVLSGVTVKASPGAGLSLYVTAMQFSIGAATASSIKLTISAGADMVGPHYLEAVNGRGAAMNFSTPLKVTAATALLATSTGATTCTLNVQGFTAPG